MTAAAEAAGPGAGPAAALTREEWFLAYSLLLGCMHEKLVEMGAPEPLALDWLRLLSDQVVRRCRGARSVEEVIAAHRALTGPAGGRLQ